MGAAGVSFGTAPSVRWTVGPMICIRRWIWRPWIAKAAAARFVIVSAAAFIVVLRGRIERRGKLATGRSRNPVRNHLQTLCGCEGIRRTRLVSHRVTVAIFQA